MLQYVAVFFHCWNDKTYFLYFVIDGPVCVPESAYCACELSELSTFTHNLVIILLDIPYHIKEVVEFGLTIALENALGKKWNGRTKNNLAYCMLDAESMVEDSGGIVYAIV